MTLADGTSEFDAFLADLSEEARQVWLTFAASLADDEEMHEYVNSTLIIRMLSLENEPRAAYLVGKYRDSRCANMTPERLAEAEEQVQEIAEAVVRRVRMSL